VSSLPHVVVIDDSPLYAVVYASVFASDGYRVSTLTDCAVEPAEVLALHPDLLVLDLWCGGGLGGLAFLRRLRADPAGRAVPVLASTPASLIDLDRFGAELRALDAPVFGGHGHLDSLLDAARAATALADLRTARRTDPPA
jgi:CheY-like chemotaxis protein